MLSSAFSATLGVETGLMTDAAGATGVEAGASTGLATKATGAGATTSGVGADAAMAAGSATGASSAGANGFLYSLAEVTIWTADGL